jgi:hypothetical protein
LLGTVFRRVAKLKKTLDLPIVGRFIGSGSKEQQEPAMADAAARERTAPQKPATFKIDIAIRGMTRASHST